MKNKIFIGFDYREYFFKIYTKDLSSFNEENNIDVIYPPNRNPGEILFKGYLG